MKYLVISCTLLLAFVINPDANAQDTSRSIGIGIANPDTRALLHLESINKALYLPRLTTTQRNAQTGWKAGMMIYNTTDSCVQKYNGIAWKCLGDLSAAGLDTLVWKLQGNAGTNPASNFIGTRDNQPLQFRINNQHAGGLSNLNTAYGVNALNPANTGTFHTAIGIGALSANTTGTSNTGVGMGALTANTTGSLNTAAGLGAMQANNIGDMNTAYGTYALSGNDIGTGNIAVGSYALSANTGGNANISVGVYTMNRNTNGDFNIAIGNSALDSLVDGNANIAIGLSTNVSSSTASNELNIGNTLFGKGVNQLITDGKIGINTRVPSAVFDVNGDARVRSLPTGLATDSLVTTDANGNLHKKTVSDVVGSIGWLVTGNNGTNPTVASGGNFIGTLDAKALSFRVKDTLAGWISPDNNSTYLGINAGQNSVSNPAAVNNVGIGYRALQTSSNGNGNTAVGYQALRGTGASGNTGIGYNALQSNASGQNNTAVGYSAGTTSTTASMNTVMGYQALLTNRAGDGNTVMGYSALRSMNNPTNTSAQYNTVIGASAFYNATNGVKNVVIGSSAATGVAGGANNVFIGADIITTGSGTMNNTIVIGSGTAVFPNSSAANELNIGNTLYGTGVNNTKASRLGKIGINIDAPTATLHVAGTARVDTLASGSVNDSLVTADANGNLHKRTVSSVVGNIGWLVTGNSGTDTTINFIGTADSRSLMFRVNNQKSGMVSMNNTALGYQAFLNGGGIGAGAENTAIGVGAVAAGGANYDNTAIGYLALNKATSSANTAVGAQALANFTGPNGWNTAVGYLALYSATSGTSNSAFGSGALNFTTTGNANAAFGFNALMSNSTGSSNTAMGFNALGSGTTGNNNVALGYQAGSATTSGSYNILIGGTTSPVNQINTSSPAASYEMNIGNALFGTNIDSTIGVGHIGINTRLPLATLHVAGTARIDTLPSGAATDSVVTADANGNLRRRAASALAGSAGTEWYSYGTITDAGADKAGSIYRTGNTAIGSSHVMTDSNGFIGGGAFDTLSARNSAVLGGSNNHAGGNTSTVVGGNMLRSMNAGSTVMGDANSSAGVSSTADNQLTTMFNGGYRFLTDRNNQVNKGVFINEPATNVTTFEVKGSTALNVLNMDLAFLAGATTYNIQPGDYHIFIKGLSSATHTIFLPAAADVKGRVIYIQTTSTAAGGGSVAVRPVGADIFSMPSSASGLTGLTTTSFNMNVGTIVKLVSDGGGLWYVSQ